MSQFFFLKKCYIAHFTEDVLFGEPICKSVSPVEKKREAKCYPNTQSTPSPCLRPPTLTPIWPISLQIFASQQGESLPVR